jgi:Spy/CpxP family protein refolding chaperone
MRRLVFRALLGLSLSANVAVAVMALRRGPAPDGVPAEPPLFARVSLEAEQRERIMKLREKLLADRRGAAERLAALRAGLAEALARDPADGPAVERALAAIEAEQAGFQRSVVAHVLAVREVLRPEQRPAFQALVARHMRAGAPLDPSGTFGPERGAHP